MAEAQGTKSSRFQNMTVVWSKFGSRYLLLSSSPSSSLSRGLSGLGCIEGIRRGGISLGTMSIIETLGTGPTTVITFEGC